MTLIASKKSSQVHTIMCNVVNCNGIQNLWHVTYILICCRTQVYWKFEISGKNNRNQSSLFHVKPTQYIFYKSLLRKIWLYIWYVSNDFNPNDYFLSATKSFIANSKLNYCFTFIISVMFDVATNISSIYNNYILVASRSFLK